MSVKGGPVRVGLVGLGRAGAGMHLPELKGKEKMFRVVAVCDEIEERRARIAAEHPSCKAYARVADLAADPEVELVDIAGRSCDHVPHALLALRAGKDVFLEKPIAANYAGALKLKAATAQARGRLFVRHNRAFAESYTQVWKVIRSGAIGEVYDVRLEAGSFQRRNDWQTLKRYGGGLLNNWGPHLMFEALDFLESPVREMTSDLKIVAAVGDAEDHFRILLKGANGRTVQLQVSNGTLIQPARFLVHGTRGAISVDMFEKTLWVKHLPRKLKLHKIQADPATPGSNTAFGNSEKLEWVETNLPLDPGPSPDGHRIWDALYGAIRKGKPFPIVLDRAIEVVRLLDLARAGTKVRDWRG
jgi:scyllo-inositol 2-dehydrogenase (NADP+)